MGQREGQTGDELTRRLEQSLMLSGGQKGDVVRALTRVEEHPKAPPDRAAELGRIYAEAEGEFVVLIDRIKKMLQKQTLSPDAENMLAEELREKYDAVRGTMPVSTESNVRTLYAGLKVILGTLSGLFTGLGPEVYPELRKTVQGIHNEIHTVLQASK